MQQYKIFHPLILSFFSKSFYQDVGRNWKGTGLFYLFILLALCWIVIMHKVHMSISNFVKNDAPAIISQFPEITIHHGKVSVDAPQPHIIIDPESGKPFMIIDTTGQITSLEDTKAGILLTGTNLIVERNARETRIISLADINDFVINQDKIYDWVNSIKGWFAIVAFPFALMGSFIYRIVQVLIYAVVGLVLVKITKSELNYQALMRLSVMSITPVIILNTILIKLELSIPFSWLLSFMIAMCYLFYAVKVNASVKESE